MDAVFTIVHNDPFSIKIWYNYISKYYDQENIYIIDHLLQGKSSCDNIPHEVIKVEHKSWDIYWLAEFLSGFQNNLLKRYHSVLYSDADEMIVADPLAYPGGLRDYVSNFNEPVVRTFGHEIIQHKDEPSIKSDQAILQQRKWWSSYAVYNKPILATIPVTWHPGYHFIVGGEVTPPPLDKNLYLLHLKRIDYHRCLEKISKPSKDFDKFFYDGCDVSCENNLYGRLQIIPEQFRDLF